MKKFFSQFKNQFYRKVGRLGRGIVNSRRGLTIILFSAWLSAACATLPTSSPATPDISIPLTRGVQTAETNSTLEAGETAVAELTSLAQVSTLPVAPFTLPPTVPPTPTLPPPSPTVPPIPCYRADLIGDISAPLNALLPAGANFVKTWSIQNSGSCPWLQQFNLALYSGDPMGSASLYPIVTPVQPGETVDVSIGLIAPGFAGVHQSNWFIRSAGGELFGVGVSAEIPLQVLIRTVQPVSYGAYAYDYTANLCSANWESGAGALACPGIATDARGSITLLDQPAIEARLAVGQAMLTRPNLAIDGWIRGRFPAYFVRDNDHFLTEVGCLSGSPNCNLIFRLDYEATDATSGRLGTWRESFDGQTTLIDLDLSNLGGKAIQLIFTVENVGNAENANAFWLFPRIQNQTPTSNRILTWTREGAPGIPCAELRIYLNNSGLGEAQAFSCTPPRYELGQTGLSAQDVGQLLQWIQKLKNFDAEISRASPGNPIVTWMEFQGNGVNDAGDSDMQAISNFAAMLFDEIVP